MRFILRVFIFAGCKMRLLWMDNVWVLCRDWNS